MVRTNIDSMGQESMRRPEYRPTDFFVVSSAPLSEIRGASYTDLSRLQAILRRRRNLDTGRL